MRFWPYEVASRRVRYVVGGGAESLGYRVTRQKGSHIRFMTFENGEHHVTIPNHDPLRLDDLPP
jgi:hypothetical protein